MASKETRSASISESDSDDEFFDALANDESTGDSKENKTPLSKDGDDNPTIQSVENCTSGSAETAKDLTVDGRPEQEKNIDVSSVSQTEPSLEEMCESIPDRLTDTVRVSDPQGGGDACSSPVDNSDKESEHTNFQDASSSQPFSSGDQGNEINQDGGVFDGLKAEEDEDDGLHEEGENKEEEKEEDKVVDEMELRKEREDAMTDEEREELKDEAQSHKAKGNNLFKQDEFLDAISSYTQALEACPLCYKKERSIMYANRAACRVRREQNEMAVEDCNKALELHPHYMKVWLRRANTYELMEKLDEALADFKQVLELDPSCYEARAACMRLPDQIKVRNEKLKEEMFGKLKDLGNMVLRPFGLSTDNFQMQQDPNSGSYSMNFQQNPTSGGNGNR
eukprot:XP_782508.3 PREDICTED: tetratricopeptide repeat protein 1 [Strongylocentrotus purpuratus]